MPQGKTAFARSEERSPMKYHAPSNSFTVSVADIEYAALALRCAMRHIREASDLPLEPYKRDGALTPADHAQKMVIEAADRLGIDLGARWGNELDLREVA